MLAPMLPPSRTPFLSSVPVHRYSRYSGASGDVVENKGMALRIQRRPRTLRPESVLPPAPTADAPVTGYPGKVLKRKDHLGVEAGRDGRSCHHRRRSVSTLRSRAANAPITEHPGNVLKRKAWSEFLLEKLEISKTEARTRVRVRESNEEPPRCIRELPAGDVNGDGWPDFVVARSGAPCFVMFNRPLTQ